MLTGITTSELDAIERVICTVPDVLQNNNGEDVYLVQFYEKVVSTGMLMNYQNHGYMIVYFNFWSIPSSEMCNNKKFNLVWKISEKQNH